ncbi:hypothetical protein Tco_0779541 [Tanacetum coccineum]
MLLRCGEDKKTRDEEKELDEDILSTEDVLSTDKEKVSTDRPIVSTDGSKVSIEEQIEGTDEQREGTEEQIEKFKQSNFLRKGKGVELKDIEEPDRPEPTSTMRSDWYSKAEKKVKNSLKVMKRWLGKYKKSRKIDFLLRGFKNKKKRSIYNRRKEQIPSLTTIDAQKKIPCSTRSYRPPGTRPPTKNQLRHQMMTYDEEKGIDSSKSEMIKEESKEEVQEESKEEESTRKRKLAPDGKQKWIYEILEDRKQITYLILRTECLRTKPQDDKAEHLEEINQNVVIRSNGQKRYFNTLIKVLSIFDKEDLNAVYQLVMDRYQGEIPEGFDRVLWGDLMIMFNPDDENEFWNSQQDWNIVSWKLHSSLGVHTISD